MSCVTQKEGLLDSNLSMNPCSLNTTFYLVSIDSPGTREYKKALLTLRRCAVFFELLMFALSSQFPLHFQTDRHSTRSKVNMKVKGEKKIAVHAISVLRQTTRSKLGVSVALHTHRQYYNLRATLKTSVYNIMNSKFRNIIYVNSFQ